MIANWWSTVKVYIIICPPSYPEKYISKPIKLKLPISKKISSDAKIICYYSTVTPYVHYIYNEPLLKALVVLWLWALPNDNIQQNPIVTTLYHESLWML